VGCCTKAEPHRGVKLTKKLELRIQQDWEWFEISGRQGVRKRQEQKGVGMISFVSNILEICLPMTAKQTSTSENHFSAFIVKQNML